MVSETITELIPLCQSQLKEHFLTWNPYMVCLSTFIWWIIYLNTSYKFIRFLVPKEVFSSLSIRVQANKDIEIQCRANLVAFLHAIFVITYAFILYLVLDRETVDPIHGKVLSFSILCWIICGYFVWDASICVRYIRIYGIVFLLHALLSVLGVYLQVSSDQYIFIYHLLLFMGTEVSTPFLHLRWFTLVSKRKSTVYFNLINVLFLSCFAAYRLYFTHIHVIVPFVLYIANTYTTIPLLPRIRCFCLVGCLGLWSCLNIYWAYLLILSQVRNCCLKRKHSQ